MRGLLIDVGGTLLPHPWPGEGAEQTEARIARMARLAPTLPLDSHVHLVTALAEAGDTLEGSWEQDTDALIGGVLERLRLPSDADIRERVRAAMCLPAVEWVQPQEGAEFVLRSARRYELGVGVITNAVWRSEADSWRDLRDFGLATYVDAIVSSVDAGVRKPNPAIFELALAALGMSANECVIVGDSEVLDVEPAKSMGLHAVLLNVVEHNPSTADAQVPTLTKAWELILGLFEAEANKITTNRSGMDRHLHNRAIGLRRRALAVRDYDHRWPAEYEREKAFLTDLLNGVVEQIEHVGSTAVAGLAAKPLIDIALGFADRALLEEGRTRLRTAGLDDRGDFGDEGGVTIAKGSASKRTHHLHLVLVQSDQWGRYLAFRDALRSDPQLRDEYAALKRGLARQFRGNREAYQSGKAAFIERIAKRTSN